MRPSPGAPRRSPGSRGPPQAASSIREATFSVPPEAAWERLGEERLLDLGRPRDAWAGARRVPREGDGRTKRPDDAVDLGPLLLRLDSRARRRPAGDRLPREGAGEGAGPRLHFDRRRPRRERRRPPGRPLRGAPRPRRGGPRPDGRTRARARGAGVARLRAEGERPPPTTRASWVSSWTGSSCGSYGRLRKSRQARTTHGATTANAARVRRGGGRPRRGARARASKRRGR